MTPGDRTGPTGRPAPVGEPTGAQDDGRRGSRAAAGAGGRGHHDDRARLQPLAGRRPHRGHRPLVQRAGPAARQAAGVDERGHRDRRRGAAGGRAAHAAGLRGGHLRDADRRHPGAPAQRVLRLPGRLWVRPGARGDHAGAGDAGARTAVGGRGRRHRG